MQYSNILITGGAGFVGSNLAIKLKKKYPNINIWVMDNLKRRGSELNIPRLKEKRINFIHGDIRNKEDFEEFNKIDLILECSAEPSVLAGINSSPNYLINTNLNGTINCLELARKNKAAFVFLSTSRVYPIDPINNLEFKEEETRFTAKDKQKISGVSSRGITEEFPLEGARSLYGATKLCSELIMQEYMYNFGIKGIINRCGVITGPWQMGKVDQGVFVLWVAKHYFKGELSYIGYGGEGKQVRDFIHIDDLFDILDIQINDMDKYNQRLFNVGGGLENSTSLQELTRVCEFVTGNEIKIGKIAEDRPADLRWFVTNSDKIQKITGLKPKKGLEQTVNDIFNWIKNNEKELKIILN